MSEAASLQAVATRPAFSAAIPRAASRMNCTTPVEPAAVVVVVAVPACFSSFSWMEGLEGGDGGGEWKKEEGGVCRPFSTSTFTSSPPLKH